MKFKKSDYKSKEHFNSITKTHVEFMTHMQVEYCLRYMHINLRPYTYESMMYFSKLITQYEILEARRIADNKHYELNLK